jgi:hypothetical protein
MHCSRSHASHPRNARVSWHALALLLAAWATPAAAQTVPTPIEMRVTEAAHMLQSDTRVAGIAPARHREVVEFVTGNVLFALAHELGHAAITEMDLIVLGRTEDAADSFATLLGLKMGDAFSLGVLKNTAMGWFLSDQRNRALGVNLTFYAEHGLDQQRAYNIVCLMVGSDIEKFKSLADRLGMPQERQQSCARDYDNASRSWNKALEPQRRRADMPQTKISVVYAHSGVNAQIEHVVRHLRLLESVAERASEQFAWRNEFSLEMHTCGAPDAAWHPEVRKVVLCYELASDFAELYVAFGESQGPLTAHSWK